MGQNLICSINLTKTRDLEFHHN